MTQPVYSALNGFKIPVLGIDRAARFYGDIFGTVLEPRNNPVAKTYQESLYQAGPPVIVFSAPDVQREYGRLSRAGALFRQPPTPTEAGLAAVFDDACGNFVQLF